MTEEEVPIDELQKPHQITTKGGTRNFIWIHIENDK